MSPCKCLSVNKLILPRHSLPVHLISQDDVTEGVNGLVKGEGAAVLVTDLILVIAQEPDPESLLRHLDLAHADVIHVHARRSEKREVIVTWSVTSSYRRTSLSLGPDQVELPIAPATQ